MIANYKTPARFFKREHPNMGSAVRHNYDNMITNMLPAVSELYLYVNVCLVSVITDYTVATYMHDHTGGHLYVVRRTNGGYLFCEID